jgi:hypothetical protein
MNVIPTSPPTCILNSRQIAAYQTDGYLLLRNVFTGQESGVLRGEAQRLFHQTDLIDSDSIRCRRQNHIETGECRLGK